MPTHNKYLITYSFKVEHAQPAVSGADLATLDNKQLVLKNMLEVVTE